MRVVVIGAGLLGVSSAYFLRQRGIDVTVVERENAPALGASYGNGGYLQSSLPDPWNAPGVLRIFSHAWLASIAGRGDESAFAVSTSALPGLGGWGLRFLRNANQRTFLDHLVKNQRLAKYTLTVLDELNEGESLDYAASDTGGLIIFRDEQSMAGYLGVADHAEKHGARFDALDRMALVSIEPSLGDVADKLVGAVHFADDRAGNSRAYCEQLASIAQTLGVAFRYGETTRRISKASSSVVVETDSDEIIADAVVVAAGAHSTQIAASIGIHLPVAPAKGYSISIPMRDWTNRPKHVIADMGVHAGINPMGDVLRVAGTAEFCGLRPGISERRTDYLIDLVRKIFPRFAATIDPSEIDPWGGHRPLSADGLPVIGASRVEGVYLNTGHGGLGWTQAAGSGKALADLIAGASGAFDLSDYSISRF
jgi:D-amino-acid dehydrogenase